MLRSPCGANGYRRSRAGYVRSTCTAWVPRGVGSSGSGSGSGRPVIAPAWYARS